MGFITSPSPSNTTQGMEGTEEEERGGIGGGKGARMEKRREEGGRY